MVGYGGGDPCGWEGRLDDEQGAPGGREMLGEKDTSYNTKPYQEQTNRIWFSTKPGLVILYSN